jgi:hypothetical protein
MNKPLIRMSMFHSVLRLPWIELANEDPLGPAARRVDEILAASANNHLVEPDVLVD